MRTCPVCGQANDDLAVVCVSCKGYLQAKVDTLDLFHTVWGLMESPAATMHRIAIARHKNYVVLLSSLLGVALAVAVAWYRSLGPLFGSLGAVIGAAVVAGPVLGVLMVLLFSLVLRLSGRVLGGHGNMRETMAVTAYAAVPVVMSLVVVFPIEIAVFGQYLFDANPPPIVINPPAFLALVGLDALAALWSFVLLIMGVRVAQRLPWFRAVLAALPVPLLLGAAAAGLRSVPLQ